MDRRGSLGDGLVPGMFLFCIFSSNFDFLEILCLLQKKVQNDPGAQGKDREGEDRVSGAQKISQRGPRPAENLQFAQKGHNSKNQILAKKSINLRYLGNFQATSASTEPFKLVFVGHYQLLLRKSQKRRNEV